MWDRRIAEGAAMTDVERVAIAAQAEWDRQYTGLWQMLQAGGGDTGVTTSIAGPDGIKVIRIPAHREGMRPDPARALARLLMFGSWPKGRPGPDLVGEILIGATQAIFVAALAEVAIPGALIAKLREAGFTARDLVDLIQTSAQGVKYMTLLANLWKKWGALGATLLALIGAALTVFGAAEPAALIKSISDLLGINPEIVGTGAVGALLLGIVTIGKRLYSLGQKSFGPAIPGEPVGVKKWLWRIGGLLGALGTISVVILGALGHAQAASQVDGLLKLIGGQDQALATVLGTTVPAAVAVITYIMAKYKAATAKP
jgi:hypothetical protein